MYPSALWGERGRKREREDRWERERGRVEKERSVYFKGRER
jgi:hypothetical protein